MKTQTHERENPTCGTIAKYIVIAFLIISMVDFFTCGIYKAESQPKKEIQSSLVRAKNYEVYELFN